MADVEISSVITPPAEQMVSSVINVGPEGPPGSSGTDCNAAIDISGHRVVVLNENGEAIYADNTVLAHAGRIAGVTKHASVAGSVVRPVVTGEIVEPSWNWSPGLVFLGTDGHLTQSLPMTGFLQVIGDARAPNRLFVRIREPLILT